MITLITTGHWVLSHYTKYYASDYDDDEYLKENLISSIPEFNHYFYLFYFNRLLIKAYI